MGREPPFARYGSDRPQCAPIPVVQPGRARTHKLPFVHNGIQCQLVGWEAALRGNLKTWRLYYLQMHAPGAESGLLECLGKVPHGGPVSPASQTATYNRSD